MPVASLNADSTRASGGGVLEMRSGIADIRLLTNGLLS